MTEPAKTAAASEGGAQQANSGTSEVPERHRIDVGALELQPPAATLLLLR